MKKPIHKKTSIRTRILLSVLALITSVLIIIIIFFNVLVTQYIRSNLNDQLLRVKNWAFQNGQFNERLLYPPAPPPQNSNGNKPDIRKIPRGEFGRGEVLVLDEDYTMVFPSEDRIFVREYNDLLEIKEQLKKARINLGNESMMHLTVSEREYYFVSLKLNTQENQKKTYFLYCIDMSSIVNFSRRINLVMLMVLLLALILSTGLAVLLSVVITKPIKELTGFANRIGHGDFSACKTRYQDLELSTLSDSMNKAAEQLEQYNREQKIFFQNVSHELRTPLQSIKSNAEAIEYQVMDDKKASRIIVSETDRLSEMVDGLLYYSYLDSTKDKLQLDWVDIREVLSNCVERQRSIADNQSICFVFDFDKKPVMLFCDEKRMSKAFSNVISNAIRYAKQTITLSCTNQDSLIIVMIRDDGDGISPDEVPAIFDRFYKGNRGNHGIGLSIVKAVIEQHAGIIEVESNSRGTRFIFRFPAE